METRRLFGLAKYGKALTPDNGRNALIDLYEELLDGAAYVRQRLYEEGLIEYTPGMNDAPKMSTERYNELMRNDASELTLGEIARGLHFCLDWDGLLIGPGMDEMKSCTCALP